MKIQNLDEFKMRFIEIMNENNVLLSDINDKVMNSIFKRLKNASNDEKENPVIFLENNFVE